MANRVATILGIGFLLVGILGFVMPGLLGAHLTLAHNIIHIVSGAISLWIGLKGSASAAKTFCLVFGAVYLLLGIVGFALGTGSDRMFTVIPGQLMLGTVDHVIHVVLGAVFLVGAFMTRAVIAPATASRAA
jgi:preprotein translocase subunit Sss1